MSLYDSIPLARTDDPETSHEAAEAIKPAVADLQRWAADCVSKKPGCTQRELGAEFCPLDLRKIGRRLAECDRLGTVRRGDTRKCSITGRSAETWWPKEDQ